MYLKSSACLMAVLIGVPGMSFITATAQEVERREETVIVTVPGPERPSDELIGNANVLNREDIVETLRSSLGDTLDNQPGVASTAFGQGASRPVLRGLGAERVLVLTNGIGVIDASAASPDHQVTADGIDAEKIEILRGPAALAYGGQAIGGVVNVIDGLIPETSPDAPSADLLAAYNSVNEGTELAARGVFPAGPLVFTLSASQRDFDNYDIPGFAESGFQMAAEEEEEHDDEDENEDHDHEEEEEEASGTLENSFLETQTLAAGASYIGERGFIGVAIRQQTAEYGLPGHGHEHGHGEDHGDDDHDEDEDHDHEEEEEEEENAIIDLEQTRIDVRAGLELDAGPLTGISGTFAFVDYEHVEFEAPGEAGTVYESDGSEGRIEVDTAFGDILGATGIQYTDKSLDAFGEEAFISPTDTRLIGIFTYQTREFGDGRGVEGGLRFESTELENINGTTRNFDLVSGSIGLHRHFDSGLFIGGQVAYTERAPNESELFANGPHLATEQFEVGNERLDRESGLNLEGTARWSDDVVSVGANVFVTSFENFIFLTPGTLLEDGVLVSEEDGLPVFTFVQDGANFFGAEFYGDVDFEDGVLGADWEAGLSLDFVEAELDSGANVPFVPPVTLHGNLSAEWGAFEISGALTWAGDQTDPGEGQFVTDGYTTLDLRAELDLSDYSIGADGTEAFIEARNVTDEEVRFATSVLKDVAPQPGQNVRVGLRATF